MLPSILVQANFMLNKWTTNKCLTFFSLVHKLINMVAIQEAVNVKSHKGNNNPKPVYNCCADFQSVESWATWMKLLSYSMVSLPLNCSSRDIHLFYSHNLSYHDLLPTACNIFWFKVMPHSKSPNKQILFPEAPFCTVCTQWRGNTLAQTA